MTDSYPDQPASVPLFSAEHHADTTKAHPNPVAANQFPVFLAADGAAAPERAAESAWPVAPRR
ncbi:hypothetical protein [Nocardia sp. A7]|uniref:hypothetical protein n=1 Tax=Nocardia sp. A7 TaxID=2789274 RepID=UPI00397B41C3